MSQGNEPLQISSIDMEKSPWLGPWIHMATENSSHEQTLSLGDGRPGKES